MARTREAIGKRLARADYRSKGIQRRNQILQKSGQLFSEKSYHDVTMDEIAEKVGVAKGTIYLYFESKERLYLEILEEGFESVESLIEREVEKSEPAPKKLRQVLKSIFAFYRQNLDVLRILSRDETHLIREHFEFTERWKHRRVKLYQKILEKGVKEGSFRPVNTELTALIIFGLVRSVMFFYKTHKNAEETADEVFSVIERGIFSQHKNENSLLAMDDGDSKTTQQKEV